MRVITIATSNYVINALRLARSLRQVHPDVDLTVYSEAQDLSQVFAPLGVRIEYLPEIGRLGVKRAKFAAYAHAARQGGFVYLDSDILVLQPLDALSNVDSFTACRDDLSECPFIADRQFPWAKYPEWPGESYFNSGVFSVPAGFDGFFDRIRQESLDDTDWESLIIPGKLYDNHYLCAKLVKYGMEVCFISENEYNWQGLSRFGQLNCYADDAGSLRSIPTNGLLRLAHFAGVKDIDAYIASLPLNVGRILAKSIGTTPAGFLEVLNSALSDPKGVDDTTKTTLVKAACLAPCREVLSPGKETPLADCATALTSIALSCGEGDFLWNGLKCGASYLSAAEYAALREFVWEHQVKSVLELGAGFTTALFKGLGVRQVALEGLEGPWLDFARQHGCDARLAPFSCEKGFDGHCLQKAVEDWQSVSGKTMVFIDSPQGTASRFIAIEQLLEYASSADYFVVHDSIRDSANVFHIAATLGLHVIGHFQSWRGLTFLGKDTSTPRSTASPKSSAMDVAKLIKFSVSVVSEEMAGNQRMCFIELQNTGGVTIPTSGSAGLRFSAHAIDADGAVSLWDTPRYELPVDLSLGDKVSFWFEIPPASENLAALDFDFVKEGEYWWSRVTGASCPRIELFRSY